MSTALTPDQQRAANEIHGAFGRGNKHLLTGYAGSGKTTLVQHLTRQWLTRGYSVALTAPTHKAVAVLASKLRDAGVDGVDCRTIHSLLHLRPRVVADRQVFEREKGAKPVLADVVVIDEASMLSADLMAHIRRYLPVSFVLFVGDPAQLPPVNEDGSEAFEIKSRSHLETVVRQAAGNPILNAARIIRESQGRDVDWSWCQSAKAPPLGVYLPRDSDAWMRHGFTSPTFDGDPDTFRYLAWTNARVAEVNRKIRTWRYGERARVPFVPGEFALLRAPVIREKTILFNTNEEAEVLGIRRDVYSHRFPEAGSNNGWAAEVPSWRVTLLHSDGSEHDVHMSADLAAFNRVVAQVTDEAAASSDRWHHLHEFKGNLAQLSAVYALTVHNSQGSTFRNAFVDLADIRRRAVSNRLEFQQMLYVAATRPSHALIVVGAAA